MDFRECKIRYLTSENNWLMNECRDLDQLNLLYKNAIKFQGTVKDNDPDWIKELLKIQGILSQGLESRVSRIQVFKKTEDANLEKFQEQLELYILALQSYDRKLIGLNSQTVAREVKLQRIQSQKSSQRVRADYDDISIEKIISDYEAYPKIAADYAQRKILLQGKLAAITRISKSAKSLASLSTIVEEEIMGRRPPSRTSKEIEPPITTIFQRVILILKKKKYQSNAFASEIQILQSKKKQVQGCCRNLETALDKRYQKFPQKQTRKTLADSDFSMNISRIGGRNLCQFDEEDSNKENCNGFLDSGLFTKKIDTIGQEMWEDIPSMFDDKR